MGRTPSHRVKTSAGFSKGADLGIIRIPFLQLAPGPQASTLTQTLGEAGIGRYIRQLFQFDYVEHPGGVLVVCGLDLGAYDHVPLQ